MSSAQSPLGSDSPPRYQRYQRGRSVSFSEGQNVDGNEIQDLCKFIRSPNERQPPSPPFSSQGILGLKEKKYIVKVAPLGGDTSGAQSVICLDDVLTAEQSWEISLQKRMDLALSLSLAILQLFSTK